MMGLGACRWQAATGRVEQRSGDALQGERPRLTLQQRYGSWQVEEKKEREKKKEVRYPAEDESNNSDMTLPKANLEPLKDVVSGFLHLTVLLHMETLM